MHGRLFWVILFAAVSAARPAGAQTVVGTVVEEGTARPLAGAFILLEDLDGNRQGGVLAGDDGQFVLQAPGPGSYRLVARFIGYADAVSDSFSLRPGETVRREVAVAIRALSLDGIRAEVGRRCLAAPGRGPETARLWEEARKALEITTWTKDQGALRFQIVEHRRELDARTLQVTAMQEQGRRGWYAESPYRSLPAEDLHADGYVQFGEDGFWRYWAPDADVLLSETFLESHCFRVAGSGTPERVGLAFEPVPGRDLPDIEGVLWLDRGTGELQTLEFTYVDVPAAFGDWDEVGGRVEFQRLATGMWIVSRWHIRMPLEVEHRSGFGNRPPTRVLVTLVEDGAEVSNVRTAGGEILARAVGASLFGVVVDSLTGEPMEAARVELVPTGHGTTTAADGAYRLTDLPPGRYDVRVTHPDIDLLGGPPEVRSVRLEHGQVVRLTVRPDLGALASDLCDQVGTFRDPGVLAGWVRSRADGAELPGALVRAFTDGVEQRVVTDSTGGFSFCVERGNSVAVAAVGPADTFRDLDALEADTIAVSDVLTRTNLTIDPAALEPRRALPSPARGRRWSNALLGAVVRHDNGAPIPGAMVLVRDVDGRPVHSTVTDDNGRFRFHHPDPLTRYFELTVEHVAYEEVSRVIDFSPGEQLDVEVILTERPIELEPIVVIQRRRGMLVDVGFYDRLEQGAGLFIERAEIERRRPSRVTDLLRGRPGLTVIRTPDGKDDVRVTTPTRLRGDCQPVIWVDGVKIRSGGEPRVQVTATGNRVFMQAQLSEIVTPEEVEAIEVYDSPAGVPVEYGGNEPACGVVLIWTRRAGGGV
jgi:hypothetical protein